MKIYNLPERPETEVKQLKRRLEHVQRCISYIRSEDDPPMVFEAVIAGPGIVIDGVAIDAGAVHASLPAPLMVEHAGDPVGVVYALRRSSRGLLACCETDADTTNYTHVSPTFRVKSPTSLRLCEVSLVRRAKSPLTLIVARRPSDPMREYQRCITTHHDLLTKSFQVLQRLIPLLQEPNS